MDFKYEFLTGKLDVMKIHHAFLSVLVAFVFVTSCSPDDLGQGDVVPLFRSLFFLNWSQLRSMSPKFISMLRTERP